MLAFHASPSGGPAIRVRALQPTLHPELADAVEAQHREALRRHGVAGMVSMTSPLRARSATWLVVAEVPGTDCVGGARVDLRHAAQPLPLEQALASFGAEPLARLCGSFIGGVGEFAGLWVREDFRGRGLAGALIAAGVVAARRAGLTRLFALAAMHTSGLFAAEGFQILRAVGDDGAFRYPDDRYLSHVMALDLGSPPTAPAPHAGPFHPSRRRSDDRFRPGSIRSHRRP